MQKLIDRLCVNTLPLAVIAVLYLSFQIMANAEHEIYDIRLDDGVTPNVIGIPALIIATAVIFRAHTVPAEENKFGSLFAAGFIMNWFFMLISPILFIMNAFYVTQSFGSFVLMIALPIAALSSLLE